MRFSKIFLVMGLVFSGSTLAVSSAEAGFEFVPPVASANAQSQINRIPPTQPIVQNTLPVIMAPSRAQDQYYRQQAQQQFYQQQAMQPQPYGIRQPVQQMQPQPQYQAQYQPQQIMQPQQMYRQPVPAPVPFQNTEPQPLRNVAPVAAAPQITSVPEYMPEAQPQPQPVDMVAAYEPTPAPQQATSIPVYSEVAVNGDAFSPMARREEKKKSIVSLNPFPFGLTTKTADQKGFLFGRPVPSSNASPVPATAFSGPYMNNSMPRASVQSASLTPPAQWTPPQQRPQPIVESAGAQSVSSYDVAVGFGKGMPLPIAMSQVVPNGYSIRYADGVDTGQTVSWEGGKPWNQVLDAMLSDKGLQAVISGKTVQISPSATRHSSVERLYQHSNVAPAFMAVENADQRVSATAVNYDSVIRTWTAPRNATLRQVLESWTVEAGVQLYWRAEYDYPLESAISLQGTFDEVVEILLKGFSEAQPRPIARLHPNLPEGPAVLVVETRHIIR